MKATTVATVCKQIVLLWNTSS